MDNTYQGKEKLNGWEELPIHISFLPPSTKAYTKGKLKLLFNSTESHLDGIWKHASISHPKRYPFWDEILDVRYTFFEETDDVAQILPPKKEYINVSENCFHLWSPIGRRITPI